MLTLYYSPGSVALAAHIALEDAGAVYEARRVDFASGEQRTPAFLAINPKGRVPALGTPRGMLTEVVAILGYIAATHPAAGLAPLDDPFACGEIHAFNAYLASTVHVAHAHGRRAGRWADDPAAIAEMARKMPETMLAACSLIEHELLRGPWVMGETYSIADPYLFTIATWLEGDRVDVAKLPRILDHRARMAARPAVKRVMGFHG
jgi:glutathione S-transferase